MSVHVDLNKQGFVGHCYYFFWQYLSTTTYTLTLLENLIRLFNFQYLKLFVIFKKQQANN
ncbi:hypothetical protein Hanom_Chr06g00487881 [Helianthus anomalus]